MKIGVAVLLLVGSVLHATEPEVAVQLSACRAEFRTHDSSNKPGFSVRLELTPAPGFSLCATETLEPKLTAVDANGKKHKATAARMLQVEGAEGKAYAIFSIPKRPSGKKVKVEGQLELQIAKDMVRHEAQNINLLEGSTINLGGTEFTLIPDKENAEKKNKEGERLRHAELKLRYPAQVSIMQISRCWEQEPHAEGESSEHYTQEVDYTTTCSEDGTTKVTTIILEDVRPCASLQISTCAEKKNITVPFRFEVTLSEAVEIQTEPPAAKSDEKKL